MVRSRKSTAETAYRGPDGKFLPGNPGRRPGARNRATLAAEALLDGEAEALTRRAIELAKAGDVSALRICMDRLVPPRRDAPIQIELQPVETVKDAAMAATKIAAAMTAGELTPMEANAMISVFQSVIGTLELAELETRVSALEQAHEARP